MLATPNYSHFTSKDYENFYEPSEDTFLLLDALEADMAYLNALEPLFVFEIGSGSGLVINFLAKHMVNSKRTLFFATDINVQACQATMRTAQQNENDVNAINCDLLGPVMSRLDRSVDVLVFNPPYVVTESVELGSHELPAAWAGGKDGRQVMDRLFPLLDRILSPQGVLYLVAIKPNRIEQIEFDLDQLGFKMSIVLQRKAGIEHLFILKFNRRNKV